MKLEIPLKAKVVGGKEMFLFSTSRPQSLSGGLNVLCLSFHLLGAAMTAILFISQSVNRGQSRM